MATPPSQTQLFNPGFEEGNTGWDLTDGPWYITNTPGDAYSGTYFAGLNSTDGDSNGLLNNLIAPVYPGQPISASAYIRTISSDDSFPDGSIASFVVLLWLDEDEIPFARSDGNSIGELGEDTGWRLSSISDTAPAGAAFARFGIFNYNLGSGNETRIDQCTWNYAWNRTVSLTSPADDSTYATGEVVPFSVSLGGTSPAISAVEYYADATLIGTSSSAPYNLNLSSLAIGVYDITAVALGADGTEIPSSNTRTLNIVSDTEGREYKASNSYTYLVAESFSGLASNMPLSAVVTGVEVVVDYRLDVLVRSKDEGVSDPALASYNVAFDIINNATLEAIMLSPSDGGYTYDGTAATVEIPIQREDFTIEEDGLSEGKRWTVLSSEANNIVLGDEEELFGLDPISAGDFLTRAVGFRFYPNLATIPSYADSGDAVYRFYIDKLRLRVFFDAGSVEYYFASPDKSDVIKGILSSAEVLDGDLRTADASGILQLTSELEVMDGTQTWISNDWTIHASYPPTDANQIGLVGDIEGEDVLGMEYNGLPTQQQVKENRSRYVFITENFYGDPELDSIYGAHGLPRAFAYNSEFFYKIYTQPDPEKDNPRHVANHHGHLALGFGGGRVDISVVGEPYNFRGVEGASSWAIGDKIVGLLPLSGTILGVFGSKSIWGISGTTVDNFATQVISPNIGATEYTICDMGFPVYANAYGIYTLNQTQQYGDYLGQPMSQDISPWIRPRLLRKETSNKEVVVAWPVRHKNQYRIAFSDGYVTSMTLNGQQVPTFSFQKYFYQPSETNPYVSDDLYSYPSIVPAAVSSELDESGEERIHIAPYVQATISSPEPPVEDQFIDAACTLSELYEDIFDYAELAGFDAEAEFYLSDRDDLIWGVTYEGVTGGFFDIVSQGGNLPDSSDGNTEAMIQQGENSWDVIVRFNCA